MILDEEKLKRLGYEKEIELIKNGFCPCCKNKVDPTDYNEFQKFQFENCGYCKVCTDLTLNAVKLCKEINVCTKCEKVIDQASFTKPVHQKLYVFSGMCPICQDKLIDKYENEKEKRK
jgi:hypothetical protein